MKKLEINQLAEAQGGYDCNAGRAYAITLAIAGGMTANGILLGISAGITIANYANGCIG